MKEEVYRLTRAQLRGAIYRAYHVGHADGLAGNDPESGTVAKELQADLAFLKEE